MTFSLLVYRADEEVPPATDSDWLSIFNTPQFFAMHAAGRLGYYYAYRNDQTSEVVGRAHVTEATSGCFLSPLRGTFGGVETSAPDLPVLEGFIDVLERHLMGAGAESVELAIKPFAYAPALSACLSNTLTRRGYAITVSDLSYAMTVEPGEMSAKIQRNNPKRLRKCQREGFLFAQSDDSASARAAYDTVSANRASKGYAISMSYEQIVDMIRIFPNRFHFFTVSQGVEVIAGAVCIAVGGDVLYVFYWGDRPGFETFSPVVLLADGIYQFAQRKGFRLLDVGRSTQDGIPNYGLIRFKESLGFEASLKLTFRKQLR